MTDYAETLRKHRRLAILRHLEALPEYTSNASILKDVLSGVGLPSTGDQVTTEIAWLREQGFVTTQGDSFMVVTATTRGAEIARGIATHPDVQRPSPR
jgi:hypothetical protein